MTQAITPLRMRMIDDMRMRKLAPKTQSAYLLHVQRLAAFLARKRSCRAQSHRCRQRAYGPAGGARQAAQGSLRHAVAGAT